MRDVTQSSSTAVSSRRSLAVQPSRSSTAVAAISASVTPQPGARSRWWPNSYSQQVGNAERRSDSAGYRCPQGREPLSERGRGEGGGWGWEEGLERVVAGKC